MKNYQKPEIELVMFTSEYIAEGPSMGTDPGQEGPII